ncbi:hypothetical protein CQ020_06045 [Arthrobacter sp. MYb23]|uniref:hypothetical protein n=1 Tax=unclassified Arthrobacter TaxID=235627 RepID=UPI000CFB3106|nr:MULTISPECIES: hypothetical protein [unclassified Arthrobacter]PRB43051.1 hypothetical protein CQ038_08675 [Arthrobacter sp. MYb51]PRB98003.1 hypothetical protein CQ020_06045 [Arthrobacter sp. MYb23]
MTENTSLINRKSGNTRPLLMLGVDGVIALEQAATLPTVSEHVTASGKWSREVLVPVGTKELIAELTESYDIVWVSEWGANAHVAFAGVLGLPPKPWPYLPAQFNKLSRIQRFAGSRPWIWIDDPLVDLDPLPADPQGLVLRVDPARGLVGLGKAVFWKLTDNNPDTDLR